jgi:hypothetical protein
MDLRAQILVAADDWCRATGRSKARLATIVMNDGKFFLRIERGAGFTIRTHERFMKFFAAEKARLARVQQPLPAQMDIEDIQERAA